MLPVLVRVLRDEMLAINLLDQIVVVTLFHFSLIIIILRVLEKQALPILLVHELVVFKLYLGHLRQRVQLSATVAVEHLATTDACYCSARGLAPKTPVVTV